MNTSIHEGERIRTPRGNLFELHYDSGQKCYFASGPVLGGNVIPVQGVRTRADSHESDPDIALSDLLNQLAEKGY